MSIGKLRLPIFVRIDLVDYVTVHDMLQGGEDKLC